MCLCAVRCCVNDTSSQRCWAEYALSTSGFGRRFEPVPNVGLILCLRLQVLLPSFLPAIPTQPAAAAAAAPALSSAGAAASASQTADTMQTQVEAYVERASFTQAETYRVTPVKESTSSAAMNPPAPVVMSAPVAASSARGLAIPPAVRALAFVTLGKLCLRDGALAKQSVTIFVSAAVVAHAASLLRLLAFLGALMCIALRSRD